MSDSVVNTPNRVRIDKKRKGYIFCNICENLIHKSCLPITNRDYKKLWKTNTPYFCATCVSENLTFSNLNDVNFSLLNTDLPQFTDDTSITPCDTDKSFYNDCNSIEIPLNDEKHTVHIDSKYYNLSDFNDLIIDPAALGVMHLNIASLSKHFDDLSNLLAMMKYSFPVIGLTEHKIGRNQPLCEINLPGYTFCYDKTMSSHGGTVFFVSDKICFSQREDLNISVNGKLESTFIELDFPKKRNILCGCIYRHPHMDPEEFVEDHLNPLLEKIGSENKTCFLMGDFNLNLLRSNSHRSTKNFINSLSSNFFTPFILQPTRVTKSSKTLIDNIFFNSLEYDNYSGNLTTKVSDHLVQFVILNNFTLDKSTPQRHKMYVRDYRKFVHNKFHLDLKNLDWDIKPEFDADFAFTWFHQTLEDLLNKHAPWRTLSQREISLRLKPWINHDIQKSIKKRDRIFKKYCNEEDPILKDQIHAKFKILRNNVTFCINKSKREYYELFLEQNKLNLSNTWKGIRELVSFKSKNKQETKSLRIHNVIVNKPGVIANEFNKYFVNIGPSLSRKIKNNAQSYSSFLPERVNNSFFLNPTNSDELIKIISSLNKNKASGPNSFPVQLLKANAEIISVPLAYILNLSFQEGIFPDLCKIAKVIPVHKKGDMLLCNNYRPISLLSVFSKIYEKCIYQRLYSFLCQYNLIYKKQFGFRAKHSTNHALISLLETVKMFLDNDELVCGIFIDLQKAFDTVDHEILLDKMHHYGVRGVANDWFCSFLTGRKQYVTIAGVKSDSCQIKCGVPQGSTLGPLLFLIYINDLRSVFSQCIVHHFADDTNLVFSSKKLNTIQTVVNFELKKLVTWLAANKLIRI